MVGAVVWVGGYAERMCFGGARLRLQEAALSPYLLECFGDDKDTAMMPQQIFGIIKARCLGTYSFL